MYGRQSRAGLRPSAIRQTASLWQGEALHHAAPPPAMGRIGAGFGCETHGPSPVIPRQAQSGCLGNFLNQMLSQ